MTVTVSYTPQNHRHTPETKTRSHTKNRRSSFIILPTKLRTTRDVIIVETAEETAEALE